MRVLLTRHPPAVVAEMTITQAAAALRGLMEERRELAETLSTLMGGMFG